MPKQCPPQEASLPNGMSIYRFSSSEEPSDDDFLSQRMLNPERVFSGISECVARSLSVYNDIDKCRNMIKLPRNRNRFKRILEIELSDSDGVILKTFKDPNHYSWWRSRCFNWETANVLE